MIRENRKMYTKFMFTWRDSGLDLLVAKLEVSLFKRQQVDHTDAGCALTM